MAVGTTFKLGYDGASVHKGLAAFDSKIRSIGAGIGSNLIAPFSQLTAMLAPAALVAGISGLVVSSSKAASSIESLTSQFKTLLGSKELAQQRMDEIVEFASKTPFDVQELAQVSKLLQTMGGNVMATGEGLRLVGDAAALAGQPLQEVGLHIGRVFNAITSGTSAGESVARLQELGLISGKTKRAFEQLAIAQKAGKVAAMGHAEALALLKREMKQVDGAMAELSTTMEGKMSNLSDSWNQLLAGFGKGMNEGIKLGVDVVSESLQKLIDEATNAGAYLGKAIEEAVRGDTERLVAIGNFIGEAIKNAIMATLGYAGSELIGLAGKGFENIGGNVPVQGEIMKPIGRFLQRKGGKYGLGDFMGLQMGGIQEKGMRILNEGAEIRGPHPIQPVPMTEQPGSWKVDESGQRMIYVLEKVEQNTRTAKM